MQRRHLTFHTAALLAAMASLAPCASFAADKFPSQPIRLIVPYAPGGASDALARRLAVGSDQSLGQAMIVDNRAGGATVAGTNAVATALPNGYTLGVVDSAFLINPALLGNRLPYDTEKAFRAVILIATAPVVLAVNSEVPARSVAELVALARKKPGALNFSSAGNGSALHLAGEEFKLATGTDIVHVPYKGGGPSIMAVVAGETQMTFSAPSTILPHIQSGRLRALAVTGPKRLASLPGVPTFDELKLNSVDAVISFGVIAPKAVPDADVAKLAAAFDGQLKSEQTRRGINDLGFDVAGGSSATYGQLITREIARWRTVVKKANVQVD